MVETGRAVVALNYRVDRRSSAACRGRYEKLDC
jgi:hypothetical protein